MLSITKRNNNLFYVKANITCTKNNNEEKNGKIIEKYTKLSKKKQKRIHTARTYL